LKNYGRPDTGSAKTITVSPLKIKGEAIPVTGRGSP
jgi:hypothetical protein